MPVDTEYLNEFNSAQATWYQTQIHLDDKDQFEMLRDVVEHHAWFMNPDLVNQVRDNRKNTYDTPDEDFDTILGERFGRALPKIPENERKDAKEMLKEMNEKHYDPYLNMDLDEIKFTPYD